MCVRAFAHALVFSCRVFVCEMFQLFIYLFLHLIILLFFLMCVYINKLSSFISGLCMFFEYFGFNYRRMQRCSWLPSAPVSMVTLSPQRLGPPKKKRQVVGSNLGPHRRLVVYMRRRVGLGEVMEFLSGPGQDEMISGSAYCWPS